MLLKTLFKFLLLANRLFCLALGHHFKILMLLPLVPLLPATTASTTGVRQFKFNLNIGVFNDGGLLLGHVLAIRIYNDIIESDKFNLIAIATPAVIFTRLLLYHHLILLPECNQILLMHRI